jgi:hypothetical protein
MESVTGRKEADLKKFVPNLFAALQIMREFRGEGRFRGKVFEPVRLVISPKHPSFDRAVEACLNRDLLNVSMPIDLD